MLNLITQGAEHIYLACGPTDFRKQIEGLAALVSLRYQLDPYSPACVFLFCNRKKSCLKALRFDKDRFSSCNKKTASGHGFSMAKVERRDPGHHAPAGQMAAGRLIYRTEESP